MRSYETLVCLLAAYAHASERCNSFVFSHLPAPVWRRMHMGGMLRQSIKHMLMEIYQTETNTSLSGAGSFHPWPLLVPSLYSVSQSRLL